MQFTTRKMEDCLSRPCRNNIAPILMLSTSSKTKKNRKKQLNVFFEKDLHCVDNETTESNE